jgi:hypothetical protein
MSGRMDETWLICGTRGSLTRRLDREKRKPPRSAVLTGHPIWRRKTSVKGRLLTIFDEWTNQQSR